MQIYLLRHGIAEDGSVSGRDADRRLTEEGRTKLRKVLERAHAADVSPSMILSSPLKRALETAEIAAHQLGYQGRILRTDALLPESSPEQVWNTLRDHAHEAAVLLAGHEPLFSSTVAYLLGSSREMVEFRKGTLVRIDSEMRATPSGLLQWMMTAKLA